MSRRNAPRGGAPQPRPSPANAQNAIQLLQQKMAEAQQALASQVIEVSAGGGAVTVAVSGQQKIQSIRISPEAISAGDAEMLQDLIVAAVNEAIDKSQELAAKQMTSVTGSLGLPGLLG